jgi:C-terminal processing protease CtpA/Prc
MMNNDSLDKRLKVRNKTIEELVSVRKKDLNYGQAHARTRDRFIQVFFTLLFVALAHGSVVAQGSADQLNPGFSRQTVESVADLVRANYFDSALAHQIANSLQRQLASGEYDDLDTLKSLTDRLTRELFEITRDKHLAVAVKPTTEMAQHSDLARAKRGQSENFGVQKVEILDGNVGYLNLTSFYRPEEASNAIAAAMHLLRHADALIVDLRDHTGGSPDTTVLFASYHFEKKSLPMFRIVDRAGDSRAYATSAHEIADRNQLRPIYLLTSKRTFSAGEGIAFLLQERGRAQVIGESTAGAANPGRYYDVNPHVEISIPNGRIVSAMNGGNWEGRGVNPDIAIASIYAIRTAHDRARSDLIQQANSDSDQMESREECLPAITIAHPKNNEKKLN